jgi:hypothetical protein
MKRSLGISEILAQSVKYPDENDKIEWLRQNDSHELRMVLQLAFDNRIQWLLPSGPVPYKPSPALNCEGRLKQEAKKFYLFISVMGVPQHKTLKQIKREEIYIQMLESIDKFDAALMIAVKDKKIPYEGITPELVSKAFPQLNLQFT